MQGQPIVYVSGFIVLVLLAIARPWVESLVTVAHEGGHMVVGILTATGSAAFASMRSRTTASNRAG